MEQHKRGCNFEYVGKVYSVKPVSNGVRFSISFNKKNQAGEWTTVFKSCFYKGSIVLADKDSVIIEGFIGIEDAWQDRKADISFIATKMIVTEGANPEAKPINNVNTVPQEAPKVANRGF